MGRNERAALAARTVEIAEAGSYRSINDREVSIADAVGRCLNSTRLYEPDELARLAATIAQSRKPYERTEFEVRNETTLQGAERLRSDSSNRRVGALNFASAKNAGGGFLNGSQAQEESLARSSALYGSLQRAPSYYVQHRGNPSLLYSDRMIHSPDCPVFRNDDGALRNEPYLIDFLTSPAPNAGAIRQSRPHEAALIAKTLAVRAEKLLALAAHAEIDALVLGAWGCGVFKNDPRLVASTFQALLGPGGPYFGRFARTVFSVLDLTQDHGVIKPFAEAFPD